MTFVSWPRNDGQYVAAILALFFCLGLPLAGIAQNPPQPNVVLILADDLGWQDVACYDMDTPCPFETPNIDRLATHGLKCWQGYSPAPTCAPSRAAILSGRHPARLQKTHVVGGAPPTTWRDQSVMMSPWFSGRMKMDEITIAEALKTNGYTTGQCGKWHVAIQHHAFPQASDQGFDVESMELGVNRRMKPDRLSEFATAAPDDPYRLDENGFPHHQNSENALAFLQEHHGKPFFLYYAPFLVHTPIHTRNERLLRKYCRKMGVPFPKDPHSWDQPGQQNPYYASMVETLDYHVGRIVNYLEQTDDPRWPGHKLIDNTYLIFTSDNGGMEAVPGERITDNAPLDKGKINAKEGGVRVPLIITGPGIRAGTESQAMINGLDFYPTILTWTGTPKPASQRLDGADLARYLVSDAAQTDRILGPDGRPRDTMVWHFPHSQMQSTIRQGNYKLIRNWEKYLQPKPSQNQVGLALYQLYDPQGNRLDIEESQNLADAQPEKAQYLDKKLQQYLDEMKASQPYYNPVCKAPLHGKDAVCQPLMHGQDDRRVWATYRERGGKLVRADLIYTDNGGERYEEWYRVPARIKEGRGEAELPAGTTHYVFNLIDENHFLISYPKMSSERNEMKSKQKHSTEAFRVK